MTGGGFRKLSRLLALALAMTPVSAPALDPARPLPLYALDVWRDGLPQYTVQALLQTSDGYLWAGTVEGLVRFDGLTFDVFDRQRVPAIANWRVRALLEEPAGTLWAATTGGGLLRYRDGTFTRFGARDGLAGDEVTALLPARGGGVWIGTASGVSRFSGGRLESWGEKEGFGPRVVHALAAAPDGGLLIGTDSGLWRFDGVRFSPVPLAGGLPEPAVTALARDGDELLVGTLRDGLWRVGPKGTKRVAVPWVSAILVDRERSVWLATTPGGLMRLRGDGVEVLRRAQGLPSDTIRSLCEDREGSLWVGTAGGLARLKDLKFVTYTRRNGLPEDSVRVVLEDPDGTLWTGTYGGGLARIRGTEVTAFGAPEGLDASYVRTLARAPDGTLFIGTERGLYAMRRGRIAPVDLPFTAPRVDALHVRRDGGLLVAVERSGLWELRDGHAAKLALGDPDGTLGVRVIDEEPDGTLWLGTSSRGLLVTDGERVLRRYTKADGLADDAVFAIRRDPDGTLWIGTHEGLTRLRGGRMASVGAAAGLRVPTVFQILDDGLGSFWLTSHRGITRVSRASVEAVLDGRARRVDAELFGRKDGLGADQCNGATQPAGARLADGRLAVPTLGGLTLIDPLNLHRNAVAPPVHITGVLEDGRPVALGSSAPVPWRCRRLEFRFDGLSLLAPGLVTFRFRMEGLDPDWVDAGARRAAFYTSLPAGSYRFRVEARNNDGVPSVQPAEVVFEMESAPWRRWWAVLAYAAAAAAGFLGAVRVRERRLRRRNAVLEARVAERTAALADANLRLERLSVTDPLTGVANRRRFDEALDREWRRAARNERPLALILVDVDRFKLYNDSHGHRAGDDCLKAVAEAMSGSLSRGSDLLARYGGEEFIVLLPETALDEAAAHAERLREAVEALRRPHPGLPGGVVTISAGVAALDPERKYASPDALLGAADDALYRAKEEGRNRVRSARAPG